MTLYVCIHGHFYQPPRENPWLEEIELQESAHPFHDWNERVTAEAYLPNAASRIMDEKGRIADIVCNYERISFDFGPTLLRWIEAQSPRLYDALLEADRKSRDRFSGHGAAVAQAYSHAILPLSNPRDRTTDIRWGIADFVHRFGRKPEGMWLPETAVDLATLDALAAEGVRYTILAPRQAGRIRPRGSVEWLPVNEAELDTTIPYRCNLPSGRSIDLLFYDGSLAHQVSFGDLLGNGEELARRMVKRFDKAEDDKPRLVHIATDGETFGHHHMFGDMALAYCLRTIEKEKLGRITVYGEFLELCPPSFEVEINERTSWSCVHGTKRWAEDCGCNTGGTPGFHQKWRAPLRSAVSWLATRLNEIFDGDGGAWFFDPASARDDYIRVILNRSPENVEGFLARNVKTPFGSLVEGEKKRILSLCEMARHGLLMQASCGWFFDEISGIEPIQNMRSAARAMQLARDVTGMDLEPNFLDMLRKAPSNNPVYGDGARLYEALVKPALVDLARMGGNCVMSSFYPESCSAEILTERRGRARTSSSKVIRACGHVTELVRREERTSGKVRLAVGRARVRSLATWEEAVFDFAFTHLGDLHMNGVVGPALADEEFETLRADLAHTLHHGDLAELFRLMEARLGSRRFSFWHMFRDEQVRILTSLTENALREMKQELRQVLIDQGLLLRGLKEAGFKAPAALAAGLHFVLSAELSDLLRQEPSDPARIGEVIKEAQAWAVPLDRTRLGFVASRKIQEQMEKLEADSANLMLLNQTRWMIEALAAGPLELDLWEAQNACFRIHRSLEPMIVEPMEGRISPKAPKADEEAGGRKGEKGNAQKAQAWLDSFHALSVLLGLSPPS